jgi:SAM-dependent methyltransferase
MATPSYVIRGGLEGRERLRVLARVMWPTTSALFARVGVASDARCLDLGCGGGDLTLALAGLVPDGSVLGVDFDATKVELATAEAAAAGVGNVAYCVEDVTGSPAADEVFDVVYVRFVLTHLPDPLNALVHARARLAPGGVLMVEDIDFRGHFCEPPSPAFDRYVALYSAAAQARGCDPNIGPRLPGLLRDAGFADVAMNVVQPAGPEGDVKLMSPITVEAIADSVLGAGLATHGELDQVIDELYTIARDTTTVMSVPRVVQAWGRHAR